MQSSLNVLEEKNSTLGIELIKAQKDNNDLLGKLQQFEDHCSQLKQNVKRWFLIY